MQTLKESKSQYKWDIVWESVIVFLYLHISCLYGIYLSFTSMKLYTTIFIITSLRINGLGITAGAHRLWAHKAYKAKWPMRVILMILQTLSFQKSIYDWVRNHRVHHKFTDTDADPHNSKRGFFFSHIGWLLMRKHPDVKTKGATIDLSDLEKDPVVVWQRRYYKIFMPLVCFIIPTWIPVYFWGESVMNAWYATVTRYILVLHITCLVNSAAHMWGAKPYDSAITSTEIPVVSFLAYGEGWHNYHHVFPWDYKTSELGNYKISLTTKVIDGFAKIGWAYDLKTVTHDLIEKRASRTGDGSIYKHVSDKHETKYNNSIWGWDDPDIVPEDIKYAKILN
ncbi:acyl-CoA Delta-9 desaturase-like [Polistes fuscatus]|uniref:acyl-CoA Delta-9 desaturase-like n=1 Tax=Polistes fuscatus TaxID=30207 RepID=UPI001CA9B8AE|nr:acyl-CoA Delta-9 desaturase-like [Polistes fuscatus]